MKTWEMIKALTENPKLKFKNKDEDIASVQTTILRLEHGGYRGSVDGNVRLLDYGGFNADEWELVPQPIPFDEAVKAAIDGKKPTITLNNDTYTLTAEKCLYSDKGYWLKVTHENDPAYLSTGMIDGMWTVEEG